MSRTIDGVAVEQVKPAIFPRVRQRLITRIDDRPIELNPLEKVIVDVVGPL